jgi:hypothetical protein
MKNGAEMVERTLDFIARNKDQEGMRGTARGRKTRIERLLKQNPDFLRKMRPKKQFSSRSPGHKQKAILCYASRISASALESWFYLKISHLKWGQEKALVSQALMVQERRLFYA